MIFRRVTATIFDSFSLKNLHGVDAADGHPAEVRERFITNRAMDSMATAALDDERLKRNPSRYSHWMLEPFDLHRSSLR
jgi:hypothetical protein